MTAHATDKPASSMSWSTEKPGVRMRSSSRAMAASCPSSVTCWAAAPPMPADSARVFAVSEARRTARRMNGARPPLIGEHWRTFFCCPSSVFARARRVTAPI